MTTINIEGLELAVEGLELAKSVDELLEMESRYATMKADAIKGLLKEREDLQASTEIRLKAIKAELHALGWKVERKRKAK